MATGLGIAAGAFAQNYARAMGLRSQLDDAAQQRELRQIQIDQEKAMAASRKEIADDYTKFLDPNFDYVAGKPMEQPAGLMEPGQEAPKPVNPFKDPARINAMYDRQSALLERQAALAGKAPAAVRAEMEKLRKEQFVERVGGALSLIEAGDEAGIKQLQAVYDLYPDGRKITGGKINEDGSVLLQYEQGGKPGERVISRNQLLEFSKLALNPADAAKLRFQLTESQRERDFRAGESQKGRDFTAGESEKDRTFKAGEGEKDRAFKGSEGDKDRANRVTTATIGGQATVAAASMRGTGSGNEATDSRQRLKIQLDSLKEVFNPEYDAIKGSPVSSYTTDQRLKDIRGIQNRQGLAEEILRVNFERGNENLSARGVAALTEGLVSGQIDRNRFNGFLVQDGKEDRNFVVMDGGRLVVPTPDWLRREIDNKNKPKPGVTPPGQAINPRTGRPM